MSMWSSTNMNLIDIYNEMKTGELLTKPFYQRRLVWTTVDKEKFIETILLGYPFPEVYLCQGELDTQNLKTIYYVVDGQQRLTTIKNYIEGELFFKSIKSFKELTEDEKTKFLNYQIVVRNLGRITEDEIKNIFNRLNKTDYTLNSTEIIYAMYQGQFITLARELANINSNFFDKVLGEKSINRMVDISFILQIMATIENKIFFSGEKEVIKFVEMYNESYENYQSMKYTISQAFNIFNSLDLNIDSIFYKKAASFSLLVELCKHNNEIDTIKLKGKILEFEQNVLLNKEKDIETNEFAKFYNYLYQGTASKTAREYRGNMINKNILNNQ